MKQNEKLIKEVKDKIDNYNNTVYAIIGFLNAYKYEIGERGKKINLFQGRKLSIDNNGSQNVTPDFGLTIGESEGLVGEVKCTFSTKKDYWNDAFKQLKKYESIAIGWPTHTGIMKDFDIVLLVQQSRSRAIRDYYANEIGDNDKIKRPFAIVEFNRSSQQKEFFNFRIESGEVSNSIMQAKLYEGMYVPMDVFVSLYSTIKIYDVEPPMALMLLFIYECIVDKLKGEGRFKKLTKKTIQSVQISLHELVAQLREVYSFKSLQSVDHSSNQPEFPKQEWVKQALDKLTEIGEGVWNNKSNGEFTYQLSQKEGNILDYYIIKCIGNSATQPELFG